MKKALRPLERPPALYQSVQESLKNYILANELSPGDMLPSEGDLARQLGVSRNSVREAVKALASLGILEARRGSGLFVSDFSFEPLLDNLPYALMFDSQDLVDLLQMRRVLELGMMEEALAAVSEVQLSRLQELVEVMRVRAEQGRGFPQQDREFHQTLYEGLGNGVPLKILDAFWLAFHNASQHVQVRNRDPMCIFLEHRDIFEAVVAGDSARARMALRKHYDGILGRLEKEAPVPEGRVEQAAMLE